MLDKHLPNHREVVLEILNIGRRLEAGAVIENDAIDKAIVFINNLLKPDVIGQSELLKAFVEEYIEAWESGMAGDHSVYNKAKSL